MHVIWMIKLTMPHPEFPEISNSFLRLSKPVLYKHREIYEYREMLFYGAMFRLGDCVLMFFLSDLRLQSECVNLCREKSVQSLRSTLKKIFS